MFYLCWFHCFSSVLTLLKATYASPGLNLPFAGVISMTISGSVNPWHLCIVTAQASVNGNWLLVAWYDVFLCMRMLPVFYILVQHFCFYFCKHLCVLLLVQTCLLPKATNMQIIFPVLSSITTFVTVPIAPFVNPSFTLIFVVIITLAWTFIQ